MTRKQLEGLQHCPDKRVQQVVEAALELSNKLEEAEKEAVNAQVRAASFARRCRDVLEQRKQESAAQVRELQERLAAKEQEYRILVILQRDGTVELWSKHKLPVHFAYLHDLGRGGDDEAEEYMRGRLPELWRNIYDSDESRRIGMGTAKSCLDKWQYKDVQQKLAAVAAMKEMEKALGGVKP